jgi:hypothetical protein
MSEDDGLKAMGQIDQLLDRAVGEPGVGRMRDRFLLHDSIHHDPLGWRRKRSGAEPASSVPFQTVSPVSTWRQRDYGTSPEQRGRPNAT